MAQIKIDIDDKNFDITKLISLLAGNSRVTINIFTSEEEINNSENLIIDKQGVVIIEDKSPVITLEQRLTKLASLPKSEQSALASKLRTEGIGWTQMAKHLGIRADTLYRRVKAHEAKSTKAKVTKPKKVKPKPAPKPKKPSVPSLSEAEVIDCVYSFIRGKKEGGIHFSKHISQALVTSYEKQYKADAKLTKFKTTISSRIDDAMNKIALVLGPTKCMVTRSRGPNGDFTIQLMVYTKDIPTSEALSKELAKIGLLS